MRISSFPTAVLLGVAVGLLPGTVLASCAGFPAIEEHLERAEIVFIGTVVSLADSDRTAVVDVEEVWRGEEIPARVTVYGAADPDDPTMMTSVDRVYASSTRYLFAVTLDEGRLRDDSCTATREWSEDLAALRPTTVTTPVPVESDPGAGVPAPAIAIVLAVIAIGAVGLLAFRSRP